MVEGTRRAFGRLRVVAQGASRRALGLSVLFLAVVGAAVVGALLLAGNAEGASTLSATITGPQSGPGVTAIGSMTCAAADSVLSTDAGSSTTPALPIGPSGLVKLSGTTLAIGTVPATPGSCTTLTLVGTTTLFGKSAGLLVVGTWPTATSTSPTFTLVFSGSNVSLGTLVSASNPGPGVELSSALLGVTSSSGAVTVKGATLPASAQAFLGSASSLDVAPTAVTLRAVLAGTGDVATGLSDVGVTPSSVVVQGTLSASVSGLATSSAPTVTAGLSLSASVALDVSTPNWLSLTNPFTLSIKGSTSGTWAVSAGGGVTVALPDSSSLPVTATISIAKATSGVAVTLDATLGTVVAPFGQSWLTLDKAGISWTISSSGTSATLSATATISGSTYTVTATVSSSGVSVDLSTTASLDAQTLASDLGLASWPSSAPDLTLSGLDVYLDVPRSGSITVAVTGTATLSISNHSYSVDALVRDQLGTGGGLLVAARPAQTVTLDQLLGTSITPDFTLPKVSVVFATSALKKASSALDPPTLRYFSGTLCPATNQTCSFTLDVPAGVGISASVTLPSTVQGLLCNLVGTSSSSCAGLLTGPVVIDGQVPLFGGSTTSLTIHLPTINVDSGAVRQLAVHLSISESSGTFSFSIGGALVLFAPGTGGAATCPAALTSTLPSGDVCLQLSVTGAIGFSDGTGSLQLTGSLTGGTGTTSGWTLPSPVSYVTIENLTVQLGVTSADGGGLTLGARGDFAFGTTTLHLAIDLEVTAEPPWVNLLGFAVGSHAGLSLKDLAQLYEKVSNTTVSTSALPPVALENLYLSYSSVKDTALCLTPGLFVSGDLVLTSGTSSPVGGTAPSTQTTDCAPPSRSSACTSDSGSCLASVFLSVSPTGIVGEGHITGWSAGPLSFTPTTLDFTFTSSAVEIHISGGATLLNPFTYPSKGKTAGTWAAGTLTLSVGTTKLQLDGSVTIATASATLDATGSLTLSKPTFDLTSWFNTVKKFFTQTGKTITTGIDTAASTAGTWYNTYVATQANQLIGDLNAAFGPTAPPAWQQVMAAYTVINTKIGSVNNALNKVGLSSLDISTTAIFQDVLDGLHFGGAQICVLGKCLTIWPGFTIPGLCTTDHALAGTPVCAEPFSTVVSASKQQFADPAVTTKITGAGLALPPGAKPGTLVINLHAVDPPAPSAVTCAMATENYATGSISPTTVEVSSLGKTVTVTGPKPTVLGNKSDASSNAHTLSQGTLNGLYSGDNAGGCSSPPAGAQAPSLSLSLSRSWVREGASVTASGYVENSSDTTVTIDWGDGSAPVVVPVTSGKYSVSHVYADETGVDGTAGPFTVTASATGITSVSHKVSVLDAPLTVASLTTSSQSVDIMSPETVSGRIAVSEPGELATATVTWGDGTAPSVVPVSADGTFSATHVYERLVPSGAPTVSEPISVSVTEPDGTAAQGSTAVTVVDVAPKGTTLAPVSGADVAQRYDAGTVFAHVGTATTWTTQALDISPESLLTFRTDWGDGSAPFVTTVDGPTGAALTTGWYRYSTTAGGVTHTYGAACYDPAITSVTDADTLSAPVLSTPVVVTAPLGATAQGPGYWQNQLAAALGENHGRTLGSTALTCYLQIAQHLSTSLGATPSLSGAQSLLQPHLGGLSPVAKASAMLRRTLLTSLLNFANGTWNWTAVVGSSTTPYATLVAAADEALSSGQLAQIDAALAALRTLT